MARLNRHRLPAPTAMHPTVMAPDLPTMVILSNDYFQQRFGGDRAIDRQDSSSRC